MPQSVYQIKDQLLKVTDQDGNVKDLQKVTQIFSILEKMIITKEDLEVTRLGRHVNIIRKAAKDQEIATRAKKLIKSWQKMLRPGASTPQVVASSRPSTPIAKTVIPKSKSETVLSSIKNKESLNNQINNQNEKIKYQKHSDSPKPNGLKLTLKLVPNSEKQEDVHVSSSLSSSKDKIKYSPEDKEKYSNKKKHKKSKKSHKSPHKSVSPSSIKVEKNSNYENNLDQKNNNKPQMKPSFVNNDTVNMQHNYTVHRTGEDNQTNSNLHNSNHINTPTLNKLKRKIGDVNTDPNREDNMEETVPIKKSRNKSSEQIQVKTSPQTVSKQKIKERRLTYDPNTGTLQNVPVSSESPQQNKKRSSPVFLSTKKTSPIKIKSKEVKPPNATEKTDTRNECNNTTDVYPSLLIPHVKCTQSAQNQEIQNCKESDQITSNNKVLLEKECSDLKKKKVKRKKFPHSDNELDDGTSESLSNELQHFKISSPSSSNKPSVCSYSHEWPGVSGCRGNNGLWYDWDEEIFVKPNSEKFLTPENENVADMVPLQILPYVEID